MYDEVRILTVMNGMGLDCVRFSARQPNLPDRRSDVQRAVREFGDSLQKAVAMTENRDLSCLHALHVAFLESSRKCTQVGYMHMLDDNGERSVYWKGVRID